MVSRKNNKDGSGVTPEFQCVLSRQSPPVIEGARKIPGLTPVSQQPQLQGTGHMPAYLHPTKLHKN